MGVGELAIRLFEGLLLSREVNSVPNIGFNFSFYATTLRPVVAWGDGEPRKGG